MDTTQPVISSLAGGGDYERVYKSTRKEKGKVDWKDVEAKAKREAMWLLEWRKQQSAQMDAINGRNPPKKRRRKSSDAATNAVSTPSSNDIAINACQSKPDKDAASKRSPEENSGILPASPSKHEAERVAVVTPPESRLTSAEPQADVVVENGGVAISGGTAFEQHSAGLSCPERLVDSTSLNKGVAPVSAPFANVGIGSATKVFPSQSPQAPALSTIASTIATPKSSSALPLEGDEELLDMESEIPMEAVGASVTGRCLPIPTEDDSLWPRLPMTEPGPEVEAAWAPVCGSETSGLGPNWWHYSYSSGDINAESGWGGVSATKLPEKLFSFPTFPPPLPGNPTVGGANKEHTKERPVPTQAREKKRVAVEASANLSASMSCGEGNGISLLAAAAVGRVVGHALPGCEERAESKAVRPRKAMGDAESAAHMCTSVGGNQANEEHLSNDVQAGPSATPPPAQRQKMSTYSSVVKSRLPWRPRELRLWVRGRPVVHTGSERGKADGVTPLNSSNRMPRIGERVGGCDTRDENGASLLGDPVDFGRRMCGPGVCRVSHSRDGFASAAQCEGLGLCPDAVLPTVPSSLGNGAVAKNLRSIPGLESLLCLPTDALEALEAVGLWDEAEAAKAAASVDTEGEVNAVDSSERWGGLRASVPGEELAARHAAFALSAKRGGPVMWGYDGYYDAGMERKGKPPRKKRPRRKRETHILVSESEGEEEPCTSSMWAGLEEKAKAEAKALLSYRNSGMVEAEADDNQHWVRRSIRAAGASALEYPHVAKLLEQIRLNDPEVEVLKLHHYLGPDVNSTVINAVLDALYTNNNCQALYIQNFNEGFQDEQVAALSKVLKRGNIWCLNAGENYKVSLDIWWQFVEDIKSTNVTHAYLSEHVITPELKIAMRNAIRENRKKHTRHKTASNIEVIRRCTNMWWNPINSKDLQTELKVMDAVSLCGIGADLVAPLAERVPCSLHGKPEKPPDSPDRTDCPLRPRGSCIFLDGVIH